MTNRFLSFFLILLYFSFFKCVSTVPIHSAKTLPKGAQNLTVQIGVIEPKGEFKTKDTSQPIHSAPGTTGWSLTYRFGIFKYLEIGFGAGLSPDVGADANAYLRIPLLRSSAGTLSPYLKNVSRFGLSWFAAGSATTEGHIEPSLFYVASTGITTSLDFLKFESINLTATLITGIEYGYSKFGWTKVWNWDEENQIYNDYTFYSHNIIIPLGFSIDFKGMSVGFGTRLFYPLISRNNFSSDIYGKDYILKYSFDRCLLYSFRFSHSFRLKKE
jgi:hypothetical protein